ncbi:MAG: hypothetical protein GX421_10640 [Caldisericales bacterium]|nr:hypothetical protein [Caldisericales bacterium]
MDIEELEDKHGKIAFEPLNFDEFHYKKHAKTSVEFAISILENMERNTLSDLEICKFEKKIEELKQYLNE